MKLFKTVSKFFKTPPYSNNTIIMLIGNDNTMLTAYSLKGFTRTINISNKDTEFFGKYRSFLNQFKGWSVVVLIDNEEIEIKSEALPVLQSMIKIRDHVKRFVFSSVQEEEIVAYCKSSKTIISHENVENLVFAYTELSPKLLDIISFTYNFNFPLIGIYILTIEIQEIIRGITTNLDLTFEDKFTIFVVPTLVSGVRIFILKHGLIFASQTVPYPDQKSGEYIAGLMEQSVNDILLKYKKYIHAQKLVAEVISICPNECAQIIDNHKLGVKWHSLSWGGVKQKMTFADFGDEVLIHNLKLKHPATNKPLRKIYLMEKISKYLLNSLFVIIACVLSCAGIVEYQILSAENDLDKLNTEYYKISESYREGRKKLQNVNNIPEVYDIISDLAILRAPTQQPLAISKYIMGLEDERSDISEILWQLTIENIGGMESELAIYTLYPGVVITEEEVQKRVNVYQQGLKELFPACNISLLEAKKQKGVSLPNNTMTRTNFLIKGPLEKE